MREKIITDKGEVKKKKKTNNKKDIVITRIVLRKIFKKKKGFFCFLPYLYAIIVESETEISPNSKNEIFYRNGLNVTQGF